MLLQQKLENDLWEKSILGEDTPCKLRNTVLFLLGLNVTLRAIDEHYYLRRDMPNKQSQLQFKRAPNGTKCLVYREDFVIKTHDGGIKDRKHDRKVVWVYPNSNPVRCTVRLVEKYLSLCPNYHKKENFYLQSRVKTMPKLWYQEQVIGKNTISKVVQKMVETCKVEGFFTNHLLRRSRGTRLFNQGVDRKIVKEITGHRSDAVDAYQVTSNQQREFCSRILQGQTIAQSEQLLSKVATEVKENDVKCNKDASINLHVNAVNAQEIVSEVLKQLGKQGKAIIKIEVQLHNE